MLRRSTAFILFASAAAALLMVSASFAAPVIIYETGFEPSDVSGTSFTIGNLDGQGGWIAENGPQVSNAQSEDGVQSVLMPADSSIRRDIAGTGKLFIVGQYLGEGSAVEPDYPATPPAACIVHFSQTNGIQCLNGDGSGGGTWIPESGGSPVSASEWTEVALHIVYDAPQPYWDCLVNGAVYQTGLGFRNAITSLSGFQSLSGTESFFDSLRVIASDGDADSDGFDDGFEIDNGDDPLDPGVQPTDVLDVDGDGKLTIIDAILQYRAATGVIDEGDLNLIDVDSDGDADEVDAMLIYQWAVGNPSVPTLPVNYGQNL